MARTKKNRNARVQQGTKHRRRKPNISEFVYQYLIANEAARDAERSFATKCQCHNRGRRYEEVVDSADSSQTANMSYRTRKNAGRISRVKRRSTSRVPTASYLQKCVGGEGTKKAKVYIKKALDFGVDSGYLIPTDSAHKVLRVSSALMGSDLRRNKISTCDKTVSQERDKDLHDTPVKLDDLQEQGRRRRRRGRRRGRRSRSGSRRRVGRRRRRRRSRSRSRSRSRRLSSPQNPGEVVEDDVDDYEMDESDQKSNIHTDDVEREPKTARSDPPDEEQSTKKVEENVSDLSVDEDEDTDDDEDKKRTNTPKS